MRASHFILHREMACYICMEGTPPLFYKTCGCKLQVHLSCYEKELQSMTQNALECSICKRTYNSRSATKWTPQLVCWTVFVGCVLLMQACALSYMRIPAGLIAACCGVSFTASCTMAWTMFKVQCVCVSLVYNEPSSS